jgi:hypothetical protein
LNANPFHRPASAGQIKKGGNIMKKTKFREIVLDELKSFNRDAKFFKARIQDEKDQEHVIYVLANPTKTTYLLWFENQSDIEKIWDKTRKAILGF